MTKEQEKKMQILINNIANSVSDLDIFVDSLEDAVEEANKLKKKGYDLFRGQSGLWPVISNLNRLQENEREQVVKKAFLIEQFVSKFKEMEGQDKVIALMQHYGLPTNFVDFSTDPNVAAFFTTTISGYEPNEYACIICIVSEEVEAIINITKDEMPTEPELINVCENNLLRQKSQKGKFLFLPGVGFEIALPFKRIVFKNSSDNAKKFNELKFFPEEKSEIEEYMDSLIKLMQNTNII